MEISRFKDIWDSLDPKPHQITDNMKWIVDYIEGIKAKVIVEIGMANGGSLKYFEQSILSNNIQDGLIISVDKDVGSAFPTWDYKTSPVDIHIVYGDSTDPETSNKVSDILAGRKVDFLFIDGGHRHGTPEKDFNNFQGLVKEGGTICVADLGEPCASHLFHQLPNPRKVCPNICMGLWKKTKEDIKIKMCNNHGEDDDAYNELLKLYGYNTNHRIDLLR